MPRVKNGHDNDGSRPVQELNEILQNALDWSGEHLHRFLIHGAAYGIPHLVRQAWDETVRVIASIHDRIVSASLILHRLGSYARQNSVHQALAEIGRVHKTIHILRTLDDKEYRRRMGRELNKGEASHRPSAARNAVRCYRVPN